MLKIHLQFVIKLAEHVEQQTTLKSCGTSWVQSTTISQQPKKFEAHLTWYWTNLCRYLITCSTINLRVDLMSRKAANNICIAVSWMWSTLDEWLNRLRPVFKLKTSKTLNCVLSCHFEYILVNVDNILKVCFKM